MNEAPGTESQAGDAGYREIAAELNRAKARAARAEEELEAMRSSTSWRLTAPLRAFAVWLSVLGKPNDADHGESRLAAPDRLPLQLRRLDPPLASSDETARVVDGRPLLAGVLPVGVQRLLDGPDGRMRLDTAVREDMPRIAFHGSVELYRELAICVRADWLDEDNWERCLQESVPEFVLLAPDARRCPAGARAWIGQMMDACDRREIPVAVWIWDPDDAFALSIASRAGAVFVLCEAAKDAIAGLFPAPPVFVAPLAIAPALYNPVRSPELQRLAAEMEGASISDTLSDALEQPSGTRTEEPPLLCESYWDLPASRLADKMAEGGSVLGALRPEDKIAIWKAGACEILSASPRKPVWWDEQQALRIAACGARVKRVLPALPDDKPAEEEAGASASLARLHEMAARHRAMRAALESDLAVRIRGMGVRLGVATPPASLAGQRSEELVSCLLVSKRPELAAEAVAAMLRQTYARLEVVLLLHGVPDGTASDVESRFPERVRVLSRPVAWSLGQCLNEAFAASRGAYWLKIDDDDIYGTRYVQDMMLHAGRLDYDLVGKPLVFTLFEQDDALYFDPRTAEFSNTIHRGSWPRGVVCGATLGGRREALARVGFPTDRRHGVDSLFLDQCARNGLSLLVADPFGFACTRNAAVRSHTWVGNESVVRARGARIGGRADIEALVHP